MYQNTTAGRTSDPLKPDAIHHYSRLPPLAHLLALSIYDKLCQRLRDLVHSRAELESRKDIERGQPRRGAEARVAVVHDRVGVDVFCADLVDAARAVRRVGEDVELGVWRRGGGEGGAEGAVDGDGVREERVGELEGGGFEGLGEDEVDGGWDGVEVRKDGWRGIQGWNRKRWRLV